MPDPRGAPYLLRRRRKESKYDLMTEAAPRMAAQLAEPVTIRPYRPLDHRASEVEPQNSMRTAGIASSARNRPYT